jgi:hypothetical protein
VILADAEVEGFEGCAPSGGLLLGKEKRRVFADVSKHAVTQGNAMIGIHQIS